MKLIELIYCMENKDLALKTKKTYRNFYGQFSKFCSEKDGLEPIDLDHECLREISILEFKKHLEARDSKPATIALAINALKLLVRIAKDDFRLDLGTHKIRIPKEKKVTFKGQTSEDLEKIYKLLDTESPKDAMILALMVLCGLRVQEVRTLTIGQVENDLLFNVQGKGERIRDLPLPLRFKKVFKRFMEWRVNYPMQPEYPFICSTRGAIEGNPKSYEFNERTIYERVKVALTKVNCEATNPHSLRHTYGYSLLNLIGKTEQNPMKSLTIVQNLLGHRDIRTTLIYTATPMKDIIKNTKDL